MANIQIKDLNESKDLDKDAMRAVVGGRSSAHFIYPTSPYQSQLLTSGTEENLFKWASFTSSN